MNGSIFKSFNGALTGVKGLNRSYLARWAKVLGIESLYREVSK